MSSFWSALWARPAELSRFSRYIIANGVFYVVIGVSIFFTPKAILESLFFTSFEGHSEGLAHVLGMAVAVIGWFYVMGGRTGHASFGLSTIVDRLLVPLPLAALWLMGELPATLVLSFAILDPTLGLVGLMVWRADQPSR